MTCFNPKSAWRRPDYDKDGNHTGYLIDFTDRGSQLDADYDLPCGKCNGCAADRSRDWAIRMYHESQSYDRNSFVTLTYADHHLPPGGKIHKPDIQTFVKALRKRRPELRHFTVGEYGDQTRRPHYHSIIFGEDYLGGSYDIDDQLHGNERLDRIWRKGYATIGTFTLASAMYVAGYVNKKLNDPDTFSLMSKGSIKRTNGMQPPIGYRWAERYLENIADTGQVIVNGQAFPIPRVYYDWFPLELDTARARAHPQRRSLEVLRKREINHNSKRKLKGETL